MPTIQTMVASWEVIQVPSIKGTIGLSVKPLPTAADHICFFKNDLAVSSSALPSESFAVSISS